MGGSGVQRPLKFIKYLKEFGWNPVVLCPEPGIYPYFDESLQKELKNIDPEIIRISPNTPFHLLKRKKAGKAFKVPETLVKLARRISRLFLYPDNKKGWIEPAVEKGKEVLDSRDFDLIFSTAPPFSDHLIGKQLKEYSDLPLVLDYRDAWLNNHFMDHLFSWQKRKMRSLESGCVESADGIITLDEFLSTSMKKEFGVSDKKMVVIPHGYDPDDFKSSADASLQYKEGKLNFLYSGLFYEQNQPDHFFKSLIKAHDNGLLDMDKIHLHFQGGLDERIKTLIKNYKLQEHVSDYGYLDHSVAVQNLQKADVLWMISDFDPAHQQVKSGKLYEYIGTGKPILGLVHEGEEADLLATYGVGYKGDLYSEERLASQLGEVFDRWQNNSELKADQTFINTFNRRSLTETLADYFNAITNRI